MTVKKSEIQELIEVIRTQEQPPKSENAISKNIISIGVTIVTACILWCAGYVYQSNSKITEMGVKLDYMSTTMGELKKKTEDAANQFVTRNDFEKARTDRTIQLNDIEGRVRVLESKRK